MDIHSKSPYPADALSNFAAYDFVMDGISCASMEGFLQSLKFKNPTDQINICALRGGDAKESGLLIDWKKTQTLYWQGQDINRHSPQYQTLITQAYDQLKLNPDFQTALLKSGSEILEHSIGISDPEDTILTEHEFITQLTRIRAELFETNHSKTFKTTL